MKEQLVALLTSKVGLDNETAEKAVDVILDHLQANPAGISAYLEKAGAPGIVGKVRGMFGS